MVESQVVIRPRCTGWPFLAEEILGSQYIFDALMPVLTNLQFSQFLVDLENIGSLMTILSQSVFCNVLEKKII